MNEVMKQFAALAPQLTKEEVDDALLFVKTRRAINKAFGRSQPPDADQWEKLSKRMKWMVYLVASSFSKLVDMGNKINQRLTDPL